MKIIISIVIILIAITFVACSKESKSHKDENGKLPENLVIIDVRTQGEFNAGHIDGAKLIPFDIIENKIEEQVSDKSTPIALYCRSGRRSGIALSKLKKLGYTNAINYGGMAAAKKKLGK